MSRYTGLAADLAAHVHDRDGHRCRWCGRTDQRTDLHHIRYRRGTVDDVEDNLISLCREHHDFVHGRPNRRRETITKDVAQQILRTVIENPGTTGSALWRRWRVNPNDSNSRDQPSNTTAWLSTRARSTDR